MMRGFWEVVLFNVFLALGISAAFAAMDLQLSPQLCGRLAEIGAALLIAYAIVTAGIVSAAKKRPWREREARVGRFVGLGTSGLAGIMLALVLSEHDPRAPWQWLDQLAFAGTCVSLFAFGLVVVFQPRVVHEWQAGPQRDDSKTRQAG